MGCSIIGDDIKDIKIVLSQRGEAFRPVRLGAFQNPELSRVQLLAMLRRVARARAGRPNRPWGAFIADYKAQKPANTNQ